MSAGAETWQRRDRVDLGHLSIGLCHNYPRLIPSGLESFQDHTQPISRSQKFCSCSPKLTRHPILSLSGYFSVFKLMCAHGAGLTMEEEWVGELGALSPDFCPESLLNILSKQFFHQRNVHHAPHRPVLLFNKAFTVGSTSLLLQLAFSGSHTKKIRLCVSLLEENPEDTLC